VIAQLVLSTWNQEGKKRSELRKKRRKRKKSSSPSRCALRLPRRRERGKGKRERKGRPALSNRFRMSKCGGGGGNRPDRNRRKKRKRRKKRGGLASYIDVKGGKGTRRLQRNIRKKGGKIRKEKEAPLTFSENLTHLALKNEGEEALQGKKKKKGKRTALFTFSTISL